MKRRSETVESESRTLPATMRSTTPLVSVVMPVRDAADTIDEAVASIVDQSRRDWELIVVDDGSTDATAERLAVWTSRDRRIAVHDAAGRGIVAALDTGLRVARAPFVARMDADDLSHPKRLDHQLAFLKHRRDLTAVSCLVESFPRRHVREGYRIYEKWLNGVREPAEIHRERFIESPLPHPSVLFRRDAVLGIGGYRDNGLPEDYDLWLRLAHAGHRFAKVPEVLLWWREHAGRLSRSDERYRIERFLELKAIHLAEGPLAGRRTILWGAGQIGRRIGRHLIRAGVEIERYIDIDPKKIGRTRHGRPIDPPSVLPGVDDAVVLSAVGSRHARQLIRRRLRALGRVEGTDFFCVA